MSLKKILIIAGVVIVAVAIVAFTIVQPNRLHQGCNRESRATGPQFDRQRHRADQAQDLRQRRRHRLRPHHPPLCQRRGPRKKGQLLATSRTCSPASDVEAQQAAIACQKTDVELLYRRRKDRRSQHRAQAKADLEQKKLDYERAQGLYKEQLIAKQDYDAKKAAYDMAVATLAQRQARSPRPAPRPRPPAATSTRQSPTCAATIDALNKTISIAPFDGIVTNVPVREGETVVVGIQNAEGSTLMTLADMSVITAEVKVDETDIVNVKIGQPADVTVDALPGRVFKGHVTVVGDQALLRSTGIATSQSTTGTEEAKDFKVVVTLDSPPADLRPGLSTTAKITTAAQARTSSPFPSRLSPCARPPRSSADNRQGVEGRQRPPSRKAPRHRSGRICPRQGSQQA